MPDLVFATKGQAEALRAQEQINKSAKQLAAEYRAGTAEAEKLKRAAISIYESTKTPQEQMLKRINTLRDAIAKGVAPPEATEALKRLETKYKDSFDKMGNSTESLGDKFANVFEVRALGAIGVVTAAATVLKGILDATNATLDEVGQKQLSATPALGKLIQLAGPDKKKAAQLMGATRRTFGEGAFGTMEESAALTFELESAGALKERKFFSQLQTIDDAATIARSIALVRNSFGEKETGSLRDLTSKSIAAALPATGVTPSALAKGVAKAAPAAKQLGLSDEELYAAVSKSAEITGSGETAGDRVNALLIALVRRGVADKSFGQSLPKTIAGIQGMGLSQEGLVKYFGSSEAGQAFSAVQDTGKLKERIAEVKLAQATNLAGQTILNALSTPEIAVGRYQRSQAAQKQLELGDHGTNQAAGTAQRDQFFAQRVAAGESPFMATFAEKVEDVSNYFTGGSANREGGKNALEKYMQEQVQLLKDQNKKLDAQTKEQKRTNTTLENSQGGIIIGNN